MEYTGYCYMCERSVQFPLVFCCESCERRYWKQLNFISWRIMMAEYKIGDILVCKAKGDFEGKLFVLEYQNTHGNWVYSAFPWSLDSRCGIWNNNLYPNDFELYVETPVKHETKPPIGLRPWYIADDERVVEILEAMLRYTKANKDIPKVWMEELVEKVSIEYE